MRHQMNGFSLHIAIFRHLRRNRRCGRRRRSITALGCIQEEVISNQMPDVDFDGDGVSSLTDCDDADPNVGAPLEGQTCDPMRPPATRPCDPSCDDGMPIFCNPIPDFDNDGYGDDVDCDDDEELIYPDADHSADSAAQADFEALACERGEDVDADCDGEPDYYCVIVNPPPPNLIWMMMASMQLWIATTTMLSSTPKQTTARTLRHNKHWKN